MKIRQYTVAAAVLSALSLSPAAFGQSVGITSMSAPAPAPAPTTSTTTTSTSTSTSTSTTTVAPPPAPALAPAPAPAPAPTSVSASKGKGYEHANERGEEEIEEHYALSGTYVDDILTVTEITHGRLHVGSKISGTGLPGKGVVITEMLTGKGGVGTYRFKTLTK